MSKKPTSSAEVGSDTSRTLIPKLYLLGGDDRTGPLQANILATIDLIANGVDLQVKTYDGAEHLLPGVDFWPDVASWLDDRGLR